ncbi:MAG: FkbM family methyltransferase, partial [Saprospiraceae bacterium]|nr:FkbM family methyltransferase [Saprospiraceae bacterium]
ELRSVSRSDGKWDIHNYALGSEEQLAMINHSKNSYSSSILEMEEKHLEVAPESQVIDQVEVQVRPLDDILLDLRNIQNEVFLKIDTQGYEKQVLDGAKGSLDRIRGVQMEMSLLPLYKSEALFTDLILHMSELGYELYQLIPGLVNNQNGRLLQVDGIFFKT